MLSDPLHGILVVSCLLSPFLRDSFAGCWFWLCPSLGGCPSPLLLVPVWGRTFRCGLRHRCRCGAVKEKMLGSGRLDTDASKDHKSKLTNTGGVALETPRVQEQIGEHRVEVLNRGLPKDRCNKGKQRNTKENKGKQRKTKENKGKPKTKVKTKVSERKQRKNKGKQRWRTLPRTPHRKQR